jgi:hypothetical protein
MSDIPGVPEFETLDDVRRYLVDNFAGKYATDLQDRDLEARKAVNEKHAPILIPRVTIDPAYAITNVAAASAAAIFSGFAFQNTFTTTNNGFVTAVSYTGRGILTKALVGEFTSAGTTAGRNGGIQITIDGNVVYTAANATTRQSSFRTIVGNQLEIAAANYALFGAYPGLPFNSSCLIEISGNASGDTISAGWHIAKKL